MEQLTIALSAVFPLFIIIGVGYLLKYYQLLSTKTFKELNGLSFTILLPLHIVNSLKSNAFTQDLFDPIYIIILIALNITIFLLLMVLVPFIETSNKRRGVFVQGIIRSNFIIIAFPIITYLFGNEGVPLASFLLFLSMIILNPLAVIALSYYQNQKPNVKELIISILKNPLVIATMIGVFLMYFKVELPVVLQSPIDTIASLGTPLALLCLGGLLEISTLKHNLKSIVNVLIIKLLIVPAVVLAVLSFFDFSRLEVLSAIIFFAAPTAVTTYPMADKMGADSELAQHIILVTTLLSAITMVFWILFIN